MASKLMPLPLFLDMGSSLRERLFPESYMKISAKFRMPIMGFYRLEILPKKIEIFQDLVVTGTIFGQIYQ